MAKKAQTYTYFMNAATRHAVFVNRFSAGQLKEMLPYLQRIKKRVSSELSGAKELTEFGRTRSVAFLADMTALTQSVYDKLGVNLKDNMNDFAQYEAEFNTQLYNKGTAEAANFVTPSANQIQAAIFTTPFAMTNEKISVDDALEEFAKSKSEQIIGTIKQGVIAGKTNKEIIDDIGVLTDTVQANNLNALVRTVVSQISSASRDLVMNENSDIVEQYQWVATLDDSCCLECANLDGQVMDVGGDMPPAHWGCRCTTIPIVKPEYDITSGVQLERASVGSDGGEPVDASLTYGDWLAQQSKDFQVEVLGEAKQALFEQGGLSIRDFVDHNFQPLTLDELKNSDSKHIQEAFKKAGLD